jgi:putative transposase
MPRCTTSAIARHLEKISATVAPGAHAVLLLDQSGWQTTKKLPVPSNITLLPISARLPELNLVENLW